LNLAARTKQAQKFPAVAAALTSPESAYVLLTTEGKPLCHSTMSKQFKWRARRAGVRVHAAGAVVGADAVAGVEQKARDLLAQVDAYRDLSTSLAIS
jgi:hypothetical protein